MKNPDGLRIAYVGRVLPMLSETFVVREAAALMRLGVPVELFSIYPPDPALRHPELPDAARRAHILYRPRQVDFWKSHFRSRTEHPWRYRTAIRDFVLAPQQSPARRLRSALHFLMAPYAAVLFQRTAVSHVHAHFANAAASVAMMAAHLAGLPFSFMVHAYDLFVDDILMEEKLRRARFVATCSRFHVDYLRRHYAQAADARIEVIHYGIDPERFPPAERPAANRPVFLGVGRLVETKGFHTFVEACSVLNEQGLPAACVIVGAGAEEKRLKRLASQKGLAERVTFTGALQPEDMVKWYDRAHCVVMPSCVRNNDRDGMPNVLIEAMARGLPVIATRVSGIPELVRDGETGLLVEPDRPIELASAMAVVAGDRTLAERLGRAGRDLVLAEYDIHRSARRLKELFTTAASGG